MYLRKGKERERGAGMLFTITTNQVNVLFKAWKTGKVEAEKATIDQMYTMARNQGRDGSTSILRKMDRAIRGAIDAIFAGDFAKAQECIDAFAAADAESRREWMEIEAMKARFATTAA